MTTPKVPDRLRVPAGRGDELQVNRACLHEMPVLINESATYKLRRDLEIEMRRSLRGAARFRNIVKHSLAFNPNQTVDIGDRPTFYVVIIYDDSRAGRRAKHFYDRGNSGARG